MKPFWGIDLTGNRKNTEFNGAEFLVQTPSAALAASLEASVGKAKKTVERAKLPMPFRVLLYVCGFAALFVAVGLLRADVSFREGYQNAPGLFWIGGVSAVIWLILWLWARRRANTVLGSEESERTASHLAGVADAVSRELGIPKDAEDADVLSFFYIMKGEKMKIRTKSLQLAQYLNPTFTVFSDEENLYLANTEGKYAFPLSSVVAVRTVKKHIRIVKWNKEEPLNKGVYKQYRMTKDNYGCVHCGYYHIVEVRGRQETYGIYVPCYELPLFEKHLRR